MDSKADAFAKVPAPSAAPQTVVVEYTCALALLTPCHWFGLVKTIGILLVAWSLCYALPVILLLRRGDVARDPVASCALSGG